MIDIVDEEEEYDVKIRESFQLLTQGVEMIQYEVARAGVSKTSRSKKVLWLDPDNLRICIADSRPRQRLSDRIPPGVYLRDVSEVRAGFNAFDFNAHPDPPEEGSEDMCLSLIATERVISVQLPTSFSRDWFMERFSLLVDDVWPLQMRGIRSKLMWTSMSRRSEVDADIASETRQFLNEGIKVLFHQRGGSVQRAFLRHFEDRLQLTAAYNGRCLSSESVMASLAVSDVVEIRPGTHSYVFAQSGCLEFENECVSFVGTECTLDIQLASRNARDLLVHKMKFFVDSWTGGDDIV
ncbi:unnamed protein product [Symbiodinium microadriaticum]|nr:unnamed protein product [Symbiodinium microadriaticum]